MPPLMALKRMCLRLALNSSQGRGWSEYNGDDWVLPKNNGIVLLYDANKIPRLVIEDRNDDETWEHATFNRIAYYQPSFTDKEKDDVDGTEIECVKFSPAITSQSTHEKVELQESHYAIDPYRPLNKGKSIYNDDGFRAAQQFDMEIYSEGNFYVSHDKIENFKKDGNVAFSGNIVEQREVVPVFIAQTSEFKLVRRHHDCVRKQKQGSYEERETNKDTYELLMSVPFVWLSRGINPLLDRATNNTVSGTYTLIDGPDGMGESGIELPANLSLFNALTASDYTVMFWTTAGSSVTIPLLPALTQYGDNVTIGLETWRLMYVQSVNLPANLVITSGDLFDFRIYNEDVTDVLEDYYRDVRYKSGEQYLPR